MTQRVAKNSIDAAVAISARGVGCAALANVLVTSKSLVLVLVLFNRRSVLREGGGKKVLHIFNGKTPLLQLSLVFNGGFDDDSRSKSHGLSSVLLVEKGAPNYMYGVCMVEISLVTI